jgi:hypothetical protein
MSNPRYQLLQDAPESFLHSGDIVFLLMESVIHDSAGCLACVLPFIQLTLGDILGILILSANL